jgi:hypothetical protein
MVCVCAKELLVESELAVSATVPRGRGLRQLPMHFSFYPPNTNIIADSNPLTPDLGIT